MRQRFRTWLCVGAIGGVLLASCGDDGGGAADSSSPTTTAVEQPKTGGTLSFGTYSETAGLDPVISSGNGVTGYNEMAAVYDTLVRYNPQTGAYDNNFATSVTSNADFTVWTVKLKDGIKFSDGTPYDAAAVKFGMDRHRSGTVSMTAAGETCAQLYACPRNVTSSAAYMALVSKIKVVDPLTVEFTLSQGWSTFQYALSAEAAMIPSPTALKAACTDPAAPIANCSFNLKPVGAGPFVVDKFEPKNTIAMSRNTTYANGPAYLDKLVFVNSINDGGGSRTLDALKTGTIQAAFLRDPLPVKQAKESGFTGFSTFEQAGGTLLVNLGVKVTCKAGEPAPTCTGKPDGSTPTSPVTAEPLVRQAIAAAIDTSVINARGYNGAGAVSSKLFQDDFRWYPGVEGPKYDVAKAKDLVAQAKAKGWNGQVHVVYNSSPAGSAIGLAFQTMLQAAGMTVTLDTNIDIQGQIQKVITQKDFDISGWGLAIPPDDGAVWALAQNLRSDSSSNRVGYASPAVDKALSDLLVAKTDAEKKAAYKTIAEQVATDVPLLPWAKVEEFIGHGANVHGLRQVNRSGTLFDKAWLS